jgi:hypothetical protein
MLCGKMLEAGIDEPNEEVQRRSRTTNTCDSIHHLLAPILQLLA